jgi:N6-L-threonylcarbamoyladenine synthase
MNARVLGIECTAHTFGAGVATNSGKIESNVNDTYQPKSGGIHPREAAQHHSDASPRVIKKALLEAKISAQDLSAVAVSMGPGMGPCLRTGATVARAIASFYSKPLVPVNHAIAHLEIGLLSEQLSDPVLVYVSGGNTQIIAFIDGRYRIFGETLDIALGNCLDVFAHDVGLGHPGVPLVEKLAEKGSRLLPLPYNVKGQDMSYSGLLTASLALLRKGEPLEDVALSLREVSFGMLCEVVERALAQTGKNEVLLIGGVAKSRRLQEMLGEVAKQHGATFHFVPPDLAGDNGGMIAWAGVLAFRTGMTVELEKSNIRPRWRADQVVARWRIN